MSHGGPAEHSHLDPRIDQNQVHGGLQGRRRIVVLRVERSEVLEGDPADVLASLDRHRPELNATRDLQLMETSLRLTAGTAHGVDQMVPGRRIGQNLREELALGDLQAPLLLLRVSSLLFDLGSAGH